MESTYLDLLRDVLENGEVRGDRTGTGTISLFGRQMRFNLAEAFPAVTTKRLAFKSALSETLFFIEGSDDERRLAEILYDTRDESKKTIWTANANANYWKPKAKFLGDLGRVYGVQWRSWRKTPTALWQKIKALFGVYDTVDQLANLIQTLKDNPTDRRMILTAMNVGEFDQMALPPCHMFAQFYVSSDVENKTPRLNCQVYLRSNDLFLGTPFNIAGYALLTHMIAQVTGLKVGELIVTIGDAHIYLNHVEQVREQLSRTPFKPPQLWIDPAVKLIDDFCMEDFKLINYQHHPDIKGEMAV